MRVIATGGGSAGHCTPAIAVLEELRRLNPEVEILYIGSVNGIEREIVAKERLEYRPIASGKLRRYWSWRNFTDITNIIMGVQQALGIVSSYCPAILFSKGGFVSFPVVIAAWLRKVPVVVHESDRTPGLANRLCFPFATKIFTSYEGSSIGRRYIHRTTHIGPIVRSRIAESDSTWARREFGWSSDRLILLVTGGSQGSEHINKVVRQALPHLLKHWSVIHVCGGGQIDPDMNAGKHYVQVEYLHDHFLDAIASADCVLSRAGANTINEIIALRKPHVLIPLPLSASRGDQIANADYFSALGISSVIPDNMLKPETLLDTLERVISHKDEVAEKMAQWSQEGAANKIAQYLIDNAK